MSFSNELQNRLVRATTVSGSQTGSVTIENIQNNKSGEGLAFMVSHVFLAVPDAGKVYIRHVSGTKYLHSILQINSGGKNRFTSYSGTTYSAQGTVLSKINRKSDSTAQLTATFYHTPTINVLGTARLDFIFGSGTNPATARSSGATDDIESVFAPGADVLIEITNLSGSPQDISVIFNVHEE